MNSEQRKHEQNNEYKHQNHGVSCNCGCQQGKYEYEQKQSREEYNNQYMSNGQKQNHENKNYYSCSPTQFNAPNLPDESKRFQTITNINTNNNGHRVLDAMNTTVGQELERGYGNCSRVSVANTVVNEQVRFLNKSQLFVFYQADAGDFFIANKGNGRVLEVIPNSTHGYLVISNLYDGANNNQRIRKENVTTTNFRLRSQDAVINICGHNINRLVSITAIQSTAETLFRFRPENMDNISLPTLPTGGRLGLPPVLTSLNDSGPSPSPTGPNPAPRANIGSALIPCLYVNDVLPIDRRMEVSPYYVLEYTQYWHRLWSDEVLSGDRGGPYEEITGILPNAQESMRNMIDMTIGEDWGLRFGSNSTPFKRGILSSLNNLESYAARDLGSRHSSYGFTNFNPFPVRYSRFVKAHEYTLKRMDGTVVTTPWVALDHRSQYLPRFPLNATVSLQDYKIISSYSSYDLPVLENIDVNKRW
ncbi:RICIN domain-containing protein [Bacillus sp. 17RED48]|uniref:hypothetical protein n=1 Tax=Bacillus sp. 17RED48 TaxID=2778093 RepID=UPI001C9B0599|nr:hypothetical protein [Bacillus sp. 17RED48]MBY7115264.1 RICIN domain-containing protein [Bacillus sp. 17RED48]